ncbi:unnamed protein product, partial [Phaeothamnion confervicola]
SLPTGLSLDTNTGDITGTPTAGGSYTFTIRALDSVNNTGTRSYTVNIGTASLTVNPSSLPNATVSIAYSQSLSASGATGAVTFTRTAGTLPTGLSLSSGGVISGTPTAAGSFSFTVQATDTLFNTGTRAYTVTVNLAPLTITPTSLPAGTVGTSYSQSVTASGGTGPYAYSTLSGSLPAGLTLNTLSGLISGTPTTGGTSNFTIGATDSVGTVGSQAYSLTIGTASLTLSPTTLPNGTQSTAYSQTVTASGGNGSYTYSLSSGSLPAGLSLSSGGVISGTPSGSGSSSFTVSALDTSG